MSFFKTKTPLNLPPSPPALPIKGHLHLHGPSLFQSFHNLSNKYGPLLYLRLGASRCLSISTASMATETFKTNDLVFANRPSFAFVDKLPYKNYGIFVAPYGDCWRFFKKLCKNELLSAHQIEKSRDIRREEIIRFLHKVLESGKKKQVLDMSSELMKLTNNTTCRVVMSIRCSDDNDEAEKIRKLVKETTEAIDVILRFDEILERVLKQHEENPNVENEDFVDILLKVYRDDKAEFKINRTHLKAFLLDLFIGGTATSAETLQWTIAELINHPDVFNKVREEI
ncbi:hypothetical protein SO802_008240 [Lithocarpus litseifolius]|uniref:Cytochrome P450 n=1 Tax=Lithocarpus litseifolius TaxID=425828 RepID=A0AAW2D831_9ROSI